MRFSALVIATALAAASNVYAHDLFHQPRGEHAEMARNLQERGLLGDLLGSLPSGVLSDVPAVATGIVTVSNTKPAAAGQTAKAKGAVRGKPKKLPSCANAASLGGACNPVTGSCCEDGLTCVSKVCIRMCGIETSEAYCADQSVCDESLGYVCTNNRCRPPLGAVRVDNGDVCDQGAENTAFCIPGRGVCIDGQCEPCVLHA